MKFDLSEIRELIQILNKTDVTELELKDGDTQLTIRKNTGTTMVSAVPLMATSPMSAAVPTATPSNLVEVKAPMVGTFYRATSPEADPFVEVNDRVRVGQTVCIIEAMKLMNNIDAESAGRIAEILVENGQPVEFGQVLFRLEMG